MKKCFVYLMLLLLAVLTAQPSSAQAPTATPEEAVTALLNRIGGNGAADRFEIVIDANLAENGKDVFVITAQNGKPCIKGNSQLSVATGINWYLNHVAHINLTWNNLTTDLVNIDLPVPGGEDKHVCNTTYRYDFNTCTFSYSMAFWTWERWQKEIDWMALHGINAPLNLVGLDVVTRNFLKELGVSDSDINAYIAGPGFIAWFAMNNLEGWGGTINSASTGVNMSGNPEWWYTRQEQLCKNMLQRMRELGMQPVIPGFSGQVPNSLSNYTITDFSSGDVINGGTWAGGYTRPDILHPASGSYATLAPIYYKHLEAIMGVSEFYSMDPFHEGGLPGSVTNATCYPPIMAALDTYHNKIEDATKTSYNVGADDNQAKWIIQYWQNIPQSGAFSSMSSYGDRFIGLDLFSDNIYAGNAAKWRDTGNNCYYKGRPYIYCMLHNFGGRSGLHGRLETTMNGYFQALANNNNCQGIGATPEGTETNPILYDMLFELPWMDVNNRPTADEWLAEYAHSRYGVNTTEAPNGLAALQNLKKSVWNCEVNQQGTSEAVILARPNWTINNVSSWSTSAIYWDTQDVRLAADQLISIADLVTANGGKSGVANYNYDAIDVIRQAMVDYAAELLPLIKAAYDSKNTDEYTRLYQLYLQLMLDLDEMLSYDENFKLERWTSLARNIAGEVDGTTENDRNWLEWNARTQVTVWSKGNTDLHDYSNRCWAGLIKDFHYWRWKYFFENNGNAPSGGWFSGFEYPWTVDFNNVYSYAGDYSQIVIPNDMTATAKAVETFGKYFGRVKGATKNYIFPMGVETNGTKSDVIPEVYRGKTVELPLIIGKDVTITSVWIDLNADGAAGAAENLAADGMNVTIPADAAIGKTKATVVFSDGTNISFNIALIEDITENRTVTAATADANMGAVAIEGTNELTITNMEAVKITATANSGYNFENWTDAQGNVVSNDNPYIYYGKDAASFTANFIQDKWGVVECNGALSGDIAGYAQFIHNLTFAYYNREPETILEATTAPTQIFNTIPQIIDVPQGASFTVKYDNGSSTGLQYCYFRAFIDMNADGDFDDEGELIKEVGTNGAQNTAVCSNTMNVLLPYDIPLGITHMRLRFDGAWDNGNKPSGRGAKDASIRPVYEIVLNITDKSDKAAHITVNSNNNEWGTAEVWTDETPDGSTGTEWDVSSNIPMYLRATKASEDTEFLGWYDHYGRLLTTELEYTMYAREDATYTAKFRRFLEIDGWQFEYRTEGTNIILTKVRQSGNHDLVIPETVEIIGEDFQIVGFDNDLFTNNKDLWTISLPKTIEFMSINSLISETMTGTVESGTGTQDSQYYTIYNLDESLIASEGFKVTVKGTSDGSTYNQWGSGLFASGTDPLAATYTGGFQFYLGSAGNFVLKVNGSAEESLNNTNCKVIADTPFTATIKYQNGTITITVDNGAGQTGTYTKACSINNISAFSAAIPKGITLNVNVESLLVKEANPFDGCNNLGTIAINDECENYYVDANGDLYNTSDYLVCAPAGKANSAGIRALGELIDLTEALIEEVTESVDPTGKATEVTLSATQGQNGYIWCNAPQSGSSVGDLLDNTASTFFHSNWESTTAPTDGLDHHLTIELGEGNAISDFSFHYQARIGNGLGDYPKTIKVQGSNNGTDYTDIVIVEPRNSNGGTIENGAEWTSEVIGDDNKYTYLRFMVTATTTNKKKDGHIFWHMAEFDLYKLTSTAEVTPKYKSLAGVTNEETATVYDSMAEALYFYNNGGTADELQTAYDALKPLYDALNAKKDKILNGVYNINFNGAPMFIAYAAANELKSLTGVGNAGYRLFDGTTTNTGDNNLAVHQAAIDTKATADALFTIVPKDDYSGYHLSAQGNYMRATGVHSQWDIQAFDTDVANAGVYLFEETATADVFKLKSTINITTTNATTNYVNDWGPVFGNDLSSKENLSTFTLTKITEYTVSVPATGETTLCLPFNVVLPTGVTAYDLTEDQIIQNNGLFIYELNTVASEGETLAKNTPVIIKATEGDHIFTITMSDENVKRSTSGSVLRSGLVKTTIDDTAINYTLNNGIFSLITAATEIAANQCWMELENNCGTEIGTIEIANGSVYRIKGRLSNGNYRTLYTNGEKKRICWTEEYRNDASTLFIAKQDKLDENKFHFISALANGEWAQDGTLAENGIALTINNGSFYGTYMITGDENRRFAVPGTGQSGELNYYSNCTEPVDAFVTETNSTDFLFEEVNETVSFTVSFKAEHQWATMYLPFNVTANNVAKAHYSTLSGISGNTIVLTEVADVIPANTAVLLYRVDGTNAADITFYYTKETANSVADNLFKGFVQQTTVNAEGLKCYLLLKNGAKEAFYWVFKEYNSNGELVSPGSDDGGYIKCDANKAYMTLEDTPLSAASYNFRFVGGSTGIEEITEPTQDCNAVYDLQGRKVVVPSKGLYIVNGKKTLVK